MTNTGHIWSAADPPLASDAAAYEMGTVVQALRPLTLTAVRIFGNPSSASRPGRMARFWNPLNTAQVGSVALPEAPWSGWLSVPVSRSMGTGDLLVVTYDTAGGYAAQPDAFVSDVLAPDQAMRMPAGPGNGRFTASPGSYPDTWTAGKAFYGVDVEYSWEGEIPPPPPPTPGTMAAHSALVGAAWINSIVNLDAPAATSRPADPASWQSTGFVVVSVVGSAGDKEVSASRRPILQVDAWAYSGSSKPPRSMAAAIVEQIRQATDDPAMSGLEVVPVSGKVSYAPALITDVWLESGEAREIPDPEAGYAHYTIDIGLSWVRA